MTTVRLSTAWANNMRVLIAGLVLAMTFAIASTLRQFPAPRPVDVAPIELLATDDSGPPEPPPDDPDSPTLPLPPPSPAMTVAS